MDSTSPENRAPLIVGVGEILWDLLPSGRQLGGAPANFAYCSHLLGAHAVIASRVGDDDFGREARRRLREAAIDDTCLQVDPSLPTGTVSVEIGESAQPTFEIAQPAAWDALQWGEQWEALARSADAVCFGSLAQRNFVSRDTILKFLAATRPQALRVFDVNLRQGFYSSDVILASLRRASVVKLNDHELPVLASMLQGPSDAFAFCKSLLSDFELQLIAITRGSSGSLLVSATDSHEHPGFFVTVKDTVGAGDAFTAGLVCGFLRGDKLAELNDLANRMGAWVASTAGAMPAAPKEGLRKRISELKMK